jgi:amidase
MPLGVQFAAAHGGDAVLLNLAASLEAAHPWEAMAPSHAWATQRGKGIETASAG